jgi:hypothetical protein
MLSTNTYINEIINISTQSKYLKWYINIVISAQNRASTRKDATKLVGYVEAHHIVPKCFFLQQKTPSFYAFIDLPPNDKYNIVFLTGREHFICHMLLVLMLSKKHYKHIMSSALSRMKCSKLQYYNSKTFEVSKKLISKYHHNKLEENRLKIKSRESSLKNRTYEDIHGIEKAKELKLLRSKIFKSNDHSKEKNSRFDKTVYNFLHIETGQIYVSTRFEFYTTFNLHKGGVCGMIKYNKLYKGWKIFS